MLVTFMENGTAVLVPFMSNEVMSNAFKKKAQFVWPNDNLTSVYYMDITEFSRRIGILCVRNRS